MLKEDANRPLKIGALAAKAGVSVRTIRYYEQLGFLRHTELSPGGFRLFDEQDVQRLLLIQRFKDLGFSLEEIQAVFKNDGLCLHSKEEKIAFSEKVLLKELAALEQKRQVLTRQQYEIEKALTALKTCRGCTLQPCQAGCANRKAFV